MKRQQKLTTNTVLNINTILTYLFLVQISLQHHAIQIAYQHHANDHINGDILRYVFRFVESTKR